MICTKWHLEESKKLYFLSAVCKSWFQILKSVIETRHGNARLEAWDLCSPHTQLAEFTIAAVDVNKWGQPSHQGLSWEIQLVKNTWGRGPLLDPDCFFMNHWGGVRSWLGHIMEMPAPHSREQLCMDIVQTVRCRWMRDIFRPGVKASRWTHPNLSSKRSPLHKRIGLLTMITKTQAIRGLVTESSSDSRNWELWGHHEGIGSRVQGALLRALNVWWLNFKDSLM
jgi:hypothetical protein